MYLLIEQSAAHRPDQKDLDTVQLRTRLALFHQKRIWVFRCSARNGSDHLGLPESEVQLAELFCLGMFLQWYVIEVAWQQATKRFRARWLGIRMYVRRYHP